MTQPIDGKNVTITAILFKIIVLITTVLSILNGLYLCFGSLANIESLFVFKKFMGLGIVMVSFGVIVLYISLQPSNFCQSDQSNICSCGTLMTFLSSFVPLVLAIIAYTLPISDDLEQELRIISVRRDYNWRLSWTNRGNTSLACGSDSICKEKILTRCAIHQLIVIVITISNGLSLNFLSFVREYSTSEVSVT